MVMRQLIVDSWNGAQCYAGQTEALGCVGGSQDLAGGEVPLSPDFKMSVGFRYDVPTGANNMFITGSYRYQDEFQSSWNQYPNSIVESFGLLNASVGYEMMNNLSIEVFARNVMDEFYVNNYTSGGLLGDQMYLNHDHQRLWGVNLKYTLGGE